MEHQKRRHGFQSLADKPQSHASSRIKGLYQERLNGARTALLLAGASDVAHKAFSAVDGRDCWTTGPVMSVTSVLDLPNVNKMG